jgi:2-hydroxy-6-oxonona-2,4-dienedioate hydrolase
MKTSPRMKHLGRSLSRAVVALLLFVPTSISAAAQELVRASSLVTKTTAARPANLQAAATVMDKVATIYGVKIHYKEAGSGPVVILLHGLGGDMSNWAMTVGALATKYRVIVPDQVGFGQSDKPMIAYRVGTLVDFLGGLYKELKIERASLVGNSLGGWTAAAFALAYPEKVDRLVLVDAAGVSLAAGVDKNMLAGVLNGSTRESIRQLMSMVFYEKQYQSDMAIDVMFTRKMTRTDGYTIQQFIESIARGEDILDNRLGSIKQPTLIVWGREDRLTPLAMGEQFKKGIPNSQLVILEKCGHVPQIEKAAEFNAALLKFLGNDVARR